MLQYYASILNEHDIRTEVLSDPHNILQSLAEFLPELIILDLHASGYRDLKWQASSAQHQDYHQIPIVFLSSEQDKNVQLLALNEGDDFLEKPIRDNHLASAITALRSPGSRHWQHHQQRFSLACSTTAIS